MLVQITCIPRLTNLDVKLERSLNAGLDSVLLDWMRHGQLEQVRLYKLCHYAKNEIKTTLISLCY